MSYIVTARAKEQRIGFAQSNLVMLHESGSGQTAFRNGCGRLTHKGEDMEHGAFSGDAFAAHMGTRIFDSGAFPIAYDVRLLRDLLERRESALRDAIHRGLTTGYVRDEKHLASRFGKAWEELISGLLMESIIHGALLNNSTLYLRHFLTKISGICDFLKFQDRFYALDKPKELFNNAHPRRGSAPHPREVAP